MSSSKLGLQVAVLNAIFCGAFVCHEFCALFAAVSSELGYLIVQSNFSSMAFKMRALVCSQGQEQTRACLKYFEVSMTIAVGDTDIDLALLVKLR